MSVVGPSCRAVACRCRPSMMARVFPASRCTTVMIKVYSHTVRRKKKIPIVFGPPWKITNSNKNDTRYWSNSDYFDPGRGVRIVAISVCVCLSVCLSVRSHISNTKFPVHVYCGRGSVLLRRKQHIALSSRKDRDMVISTVTCANIWWNLDISLMTLCERTDRQKDIQTRLSEHFAHLPGTMEIVFSG